MLNAKDYFDLVKRHFAFLIDDFGFQITDQTKIGDNTSVEYCSDKIYVRVLKMAPNFEPFLAFGRIGIDGSPHADSFTGEDIGMLNCCEKWQWQHGIDEPYKGYVSQLARLLRDCGEDCLNADPQVYAEMQQRRVKLRDKHLQEEHALAVRRQAEEAWSKKDFQSVATHYADIQGQLTATEQGRLSYATKQVSAGDAVN